MKMRIEAPQILELEETKGIMGVFGRVWYLTTLMKLTVQNIGST
jgi:hypothetical protein